MVLDAPTQDQVTVPTQAKSYRDAPKRLASAQRFESKLMGSFDAGVGVGAYIAPPWLVGGANLTLTALHRTLAMHARSNRPIGRRLLLLLDNTSAASPRVTRARLLGSRRLTSPYLPPLKATHRRPPPTASRFASQENKTRVMLWYAAYLVDRGVFDEVIVFFLPKGHTHARQC